MLVGRSVGGRAEAESARRGARDCQFYVGELMCPSSWAGSGITVVDGHTILEFYIIIHNSSVKLKFIFTFMHNFVATVRVLHLCVAVLAVMASVSTCKSL